jgi:hypothetical protein
LLNVTLTAITCPLHILSVLLLLLLQRRMLMQRQLTPNDHDFYIMEIENGFYVDGKHKGNQSRFINHSCDPNCELVVSDQCNLSYHHAIKSPNKPRVTDSVTLP